jgi:exopolysaccharide production protein ExoZ
MRRLLGLQYMRALAACAVVAYHAADRAGEPFAAGEAGVDLFFVLSGFLMWAITDAASRPAAFFADRAMRIVPSYWIVTSVMLTGALLGAFPAVQLTVSHVIASYSFIPAISPSNGQVWPLLVPGWTLNYEAGFYFLFGSALLLPRRCQLVALTFVLLVLVTLHPLVGKNHTLLYFYTDPHILEFLGGLWLAQGWRKGMFARAYLAQIMVVATLTLFAASLALPAEWPKAVRYGLPALFAVTTLLAYERRHAGIREVPALLLLGNASYSIYLWHTLAISITAKLAIDLHLADQIAIPLHIVAGISVGLLAYLVIERPIMRTVHRARHRNSHKAAWIALPTH